MRKVQKITGIILTVILIFMAGCSKNSNVRETLDSEQSQYNKDDNAERENDTAVTSDGDIYSDTSDSETTQDSEANTVADIHQTTEQQTTKEPTTQQTTTKKTTTQQTTTKAPAKQEETPSINGVTLPVSVSDKALKKAAEIVNSIIKSSMSEYEKVKAIHDYIVINVDYPTKIDMNNKSLFSAEGALVNNLAVCQGYAEAFSLLCYKAGIQTEYVTGRAGGESHGWNIVRVDGVWYQIDVTWDDPVGSYTENGENMQYTYFLIPDSIMSQDHTAKTYTKKHSCTDSRYIEYRKKENVEEYIENLYGDEEYYYVSGKEEVKDLALEKYNSGIDDYIMVYVGDNLSDDKVETIRNNIISWLEEEGISGYISFSIYFGDEKYIILHMNINRN